MVKFGKKEILRESKPYIIAEIGVNHEGSISQAKELIELAKEGGADAAKFQTYKAEKIASVHSPHYWDISKESTKSQYQLFKKYDSFEVIDYEELAKHCQNCNIDFLSTPFDLDAVDSLDPLMNAFKIASADITNIPLLRKVASKNKPIILSTGAANKKEINIALKTLNNSGVPDNNIILLHCILNYPTSYKNANLLMIRDLIKSYPDHLIGYSDHTLPNDEMNCPIAAFIIGAVVIEKHFTHNKNLEGNDHYHAMDVNDLKKLVRNIDMFFDLLGENEKKPLESEEVSRLNARRSIVLKNYKKEGYTLNEEDLICKRPGTGVPSSEWDNVIGKKINKNLEEDHILQWSDLS